MSNDQHRDLVNATELHLLLERLEGLQELLTPEQEGASLDAISEATGYSRDHIDHVLQDIRREDMAERVRERLREMEEPLYRVERPTTEKRQDLMLDYFSREATVSTILDKVQPRTPIRRSEPKPTNGPMEWASAILVISVAIISIGLFVGAIVMMIRR